MTVNEQVQVVAYPAHLLLHLHPDCQIPDTYLRHIIPGHLMDSR